MFATSHHLLLLCTQHLLSCTPQNNDVAGFCSFYLIHFTYPVACTVQLHSVKLNTVQVCLAHFERCGVAEYRSQRVSSQAYTYGSWLMVAVQVWPLITSAVSLCTHSSFPHISLCFQHDNMPNLDLMMCLHRCWVLKLSLGWSSRLPVRPGKRLQHRMCPLLVQARLR